MPASKNNSLGICPNSNCPRSYLKGRAIREGLIQWRNAALMPGGGGNSAPRSRSIEESSRIVFQERPHPKGFCDSCGKALVFASFAPELGKCQACHRQYNDDDLARSICLECGAQIEIGDDVKERMKTHKVIAEILNTLPHLKHYGYLALQ